MQKKQSLMLLLHSQLKRINFKLQKLQKQVGSPSWARGMFYFLHFSQFVMAVLCFQSTIFVNQFYIKICILKVALFMTGSPSHLGHLFYPSGSPAHLGALAIIFEYFCKCPSSEVVRCDKYRMARGCTTRKN